MRHFGLKSVAQKTSAKSSFDLDYISQLALEHFSQSIIKMRAKIFISFFLFVGFGETCFRGMKEVVQDQVECEYQPF